MSATAGSTNSATGSGSDGVIPKSSRYSSLVAWLLAGLALLIFVYHLRHYFPFFSDDGFISLRYSQRLLEGEGLTWTDGERVEGYSNLAYVLLCALFGLVLQDLVIAARVVGALGVAMMLWALWILQSSSRLKIATSLSWCVTCSLSSVAIWMLGGLEATLYAGAIMLGYAKHFANRGPGTGESWRSTLGRSWPLALACWTRPDAPLFVVVLFVSDLIGGRFRLSALRSAIASALPPFLAFSCQLAFRRFYYHDWVPNTAHVKAKADLARASEGWEYVQGAFSNAGFLVAFALSGVLVASIGKDSRRRAWTGLAAALLWLAYVCSIGGDIFPAWRHALPAYALLIWVGSTSLHHLLDRSDAPARSEAGVVKNAAAISLLVTGIVAMVQSQRSDPENERAATERWEWDAQPLGRLYRRFKPKNPLLAVEPAGALPFFSELRSIDMYGLCDAHIARQEPDLNLGLAHDHGDGEYVWNRKPDLVLFSIPTGGGPRSSTGRVLLGKAKFSEYFRKVKFKALEPIETVGELYVRSDGRVGVHRDDREIRVPGYLFIGRGIQGFPVGEDAVGAHLERGSSARSGPIDIPPGDWILSVDAPNPYLKLRLENQADESLSWKASAGGWMLRGAKKIQIVVSMPAGVSGIFHQIRLRRADGPPPAEPLETLKAKGKATLLDSPALGELIPVEPLSPQHSFLTRNAKPIGEGAAARPDCSASFPAIDTRIRFDSYDLGEEDEWTGTVYGPTYRLPKKAIAYGCLSGARYLAGLRIRNLDTGKIIQSWVGHESLATNIVSEDLSAFEGARVQFEAYDERENAWGHVRVFGMGIVHPK